MGDFLNLAPPARTSSRPAIVALLLGLALWLLLDRAPAHADRWGTPYQARVTADQSVVYSQPDRSSPPVGPLWRDAIVVVLEEKTGTDGARWAKIPDGFIPYREIAEFYTPWTAEVSVPRVSIYAKPYQASGVIRTAVEGDLLRVTGVSHGLEGDEATWWATTAGYLPLGTLRWATNDWAGWWQAPAPSEASRGWWAEVIEQARVRPAPSLQAPVLGLFSGGEHVKVLAEEQGEPIDGNPLWYRIDGGRYAGGRIHSTVVRRLLDPRANTTRPEGGAPDGTWIVVDRTASSLTFVREGNPQFVTYVSIGKAGAATPTGTYTTFGKFYGDRMSSRNVENPTNPYDLPNVPFTQYYKEGGYGIHGTYWHDLFGTRQSQGCINLTLSDSAYLFDLTEPLVPHGFNEAWGDPWLATPVVIVD